MRRIGYPAVTKSNQTLYPATGRFLLGRGRDLLGSDAAGALEALFSRTQRRGAGDLIARRDTVHDQTTILVEGFAMRSVTDGRSRSVAGICVPGDIIDLSALGFGTLDHDLVALGPVTVACADRAAVERLAETNRDVAQALWIASQLEAALQRQWTIKLGRLKAARRVARLLSELWCRLDLVGLAEADRFAIPITQQDMADMCGTTAIHMNRALGDLRREGLVEVRRGLVTAPDRNALERFGEFTPAYLAGPQRLRPNVIARREYHIAM